MIYLFIFLLVVGFTCVGIAATMHEYDDPNLDLDKVVEAIRIVEAWNGRSVGAAGEVGPFQFKASVWAEYSDQPFAWAWGSHPVQKAEQRAAARRLVAWIDAQLKDVPLPRTARSIGLVWTNGLTAAKRHKVSSAKRDYAQRVANIYADFP